MTKFILRKFWGVYNKECFLMEKIWLFLLGVKRGYQPGTILISCSGHGECINFNPDPCDDRLYILLFLLFSSWSHDSDKQVFYLPVLLQGIFFRSSIHWNYNHFICLSFIQCVLGCVSDLVPSTCMGLGTYVFGIQMLYNMQNARFPILACNPKASTIPHLITSDFSLVLYFCWERVGILRVFLTFLQATQYI